MVDKFGFKGIWYDFCQPHTWIKLNIANLQYNNNYLIHTISHQNTHFNATCVKWDRK